MEGTGYLGQNSLRERGRDPRDPPPRVSLQCQEVLGLGPDPRALTLGCLLWPQGSLQALRWGGACILLVQAPQS